MLKRKINKNSCDFKTCFFQNRDSRLELGLFYAGQAFGDGDGDRETAPNILIVISGGRSSDPDKTKVRIHMWEVFLLPSLPTYMFVSLSPSAFASFFPGVPFFYPYFFSFVCISVLMFSFNCSCVFRLNLFKV